MLRSALLLLGSLAVSVPARAQTTSLPEGVTINAQTLEPAFTGDFLATETARQSPRYFGGRLVYHWDRQLLRVTGDDGEPVDLIGDLFEMDLLASASVGRLRFGVGLPIVLAAVGDTEDTRSGIGDLRVDGRVTLLGRPTSKGGLALRAALLVPTSTLEPDLANAAPVGDFSVIGDGTFGPVLLSGSFGVRITEDIEVGAVDIGKAAYGRFGLAVHPDPRDGITGELLVRTAVKSLDTWRDVPMEGILGYWRDVGKGWLLRFGLAFGLTPAPGSPQMRLILGLEKVPTPRPDADGDGLTLSDDVCPREAETVNDVRDDDGCPEDTRVLALAPVAELPFAVDWSNIDSATPVPAAPAPAHTGLADPDGDGLADTVDFCPEEAEDLDRFEDGDGCPEPDNDGDLLPDDVDDCAVEAETRNGFEDRDGCPDTAPAALAAIVPTIAFEPLSDVLSSVAKAQLRHVLEPMRQDPALRLKIDGHSDNKGTPEVNQDLSLRRAIAVRVWLAARGIDESRIVVAGHGADEPAATNDTPEGRALNRRVDLSLDSETAP